MSPWPRVLLGLALSISVAGCRSSSWRPIKPTGDTPRIQPLGLPADAEWVVRDEVAGQWNGWAWPRRGPVARTWFYAVDQHECEWTHGMFTVGDHDWEFLDPTGVVASIPAGRHSVEFFLLSLEPADGFPESSEVRVEAEFDAEHDRLLLVELDEAWPSPGEPRRRGAVTRLYRRANRCWARGQLEIHLDSEACAPEPWMEDPCPRDLGALAAAP